MTDGTATGSGRIGVGLLGTGVSILVLAVLAYYCRPWLHWLVYLVYTTPALWVYALVVLAVVVVAGRSVLRSGIALGSGSVPSSRRATLVSIVLGVATLALLLSLLAAGPYAAEELSGETMAAANATDRLADADASHPRILPQNVSTNYAANTLDLPQYQVKRPDITFVNQTPYWSYALAPDGFRNHFALTQRGTVLVDMTQQDARVRTVEGEMQAGIGTAFYNHYKWQVLKNGEYLASYSDPFMVPHGNDSYIAVPYTTPEFHLRWTPLPVPYTSPKWGGVALVAPNGSVEDLTPAEARAHPVLKGQKLVPFDLTRKRVTATKYRNGIVNTLPIVGAHADEIEVATTPGGNDQPYLVPTEDGITYIVAVEPYGNAQGLKEVWQIDGRTGEPTVYESPEGESLFGPTRAANYVRQAARTTDWNRFVPAEPLPVSVDGRLHWMVRVIPNDGTGVAYVAFVNARSANVREVADTPAVEAFLAGDTSAGAAAGGTNDTGSNLGGENVSMVVEKRNANGTVVARMTVYDNESVAVRPVTNASTIPATNATPAANATANTTNTTPRSTTTG